MKPYFEYEGQIYEFEANFSLQKKFRKEFQNILSEKRKDIIGNFENDDFDFKQINLVEKELKSLKEEILKSNLNEEEKQKLEKQKTMEILSKYPQFLKTLNNSQDLVSYENDDLNEKYCYLMIEKKYPNDISKYNKFIDELCSDKGIEYVYQFFSAVINAVFTSVVQEAPHQKPSFKWESNNKN